MEHYSAVQKLVTLLYTTMKHYAMAKQPNTEAYLWHDYIYLKFWSEANPQKQKVI